MMLQDSLATYVSYLRQEERAEGTVQKYSRDIRRFVLWLAERPLSKEELASYREQLSRQGRSAGTVNGILSSLNGFLKFINRQDCQVKYLKVQRRVFRNPERELSKEEYRRLVETAQERNAGRLALLMECICGTGVRVSELAFITVEAARQGRAEVAMKGKIRTVFIAPKLCRKLLKYAQKQKIASGEIFLTGSGKRLSRGQIWAEMKALCRRAGVDERKVFPHNLRHLFAQTFYRVSRDIVRLADVLGHSSLTTTRIYLISSGSEHARQMARLGLVV